MKKLFFIFLSLSFACSYGAQNNEDLDLSIAQMLKSKKVLTEQDLYQLEAKIPKEVFKKIMNNVFKQVQLYAYRNREALLPAVVVYNAKRCPHPINVIRGFVATGITDCSKEYAQLYNNNQLPIAHNERKLIAGNNFLNSTYNYESWVILQKINPRLLNFTEPNQIRCAPSQGTFAIVCWSDGKTQVILHEADRQILNSLSIEQLEWIAGLYKRYNEDELLCNDHELQIFESLPQSMQDCLKFNYPNLSFNKKSLSKSSFWQSWKPLSIAAGALALGAGLWWWFKK